MTNTAPQTDLAPRSPIRLMARRFRRNRTALPAFIIMIVLFVVGFGHKILDTTGRHLPHPPDATNLQDRLLPPSTTHPLGTDHLGRDVLSRMLSGAWISLTIGFVAVGISVTIGILVGSIAGYVGGKTDFVLMRIVDAVMCFPTFFLILTVVALLGPSIWNIIFVIGLTGWTGTSRLVRAEFLSLREMDYVKAAQALGLPAKHVIWRHILPNAMPPVLVAAIVGVAGAILTEAGLSFLGFGVQPPQATWGNIISDGKTYIFDAWWMLLFPGLAILLATMSFYLTGEGLREAIDPKSTKRL